MDSPNDLDSEEKRKQVERVLKGNKKVRSLADQKEIARQSKARKAGRAPRQRARTDWSDYDEDEEFEDFERIHRVRDERKPIADTPEARADVDHPWLVVSVHSNKVRICRRDRTRDALLGGKRLDHGPPVAGDRLAIEELHYGECRVLSIDERETTLVREDPGNAHRVKVLAANVNLGLIALPAQADGSLRLGIVERIRIALERGGIKPTVVITKIDRLENSGREQLGRELEDLRSRQIPAFPVCSLDGEGIPALREHLGQAICVVVGHSGVGKSTLLNAIDPSVERDTGGVRESDDRGRHTTTASKMTPFGDGGWLIDTPGIRSFGLGEIPLEQLLDSFPMLKRAAEDCPKGCEHRQDDCALSIAAKASTEVAGEWESFQRLLDDC